MRAYWYDNEEVRFFSMRQPDGPYIALAFPAPLTSIQLQGDQRAPHDSGRSVDAAYLSNLGVLYRKCPSVSDVDALATQRGYKNRDEITISPTAMGAIYEEKVKTFFHEHLHEDEEIRYILDGEGYFDVRSEGDEWVRIAVEKDDLLVLPAGIYHRFTTGQSNVSFCYRVVNLGYR